ncbi:MAG: efflux RND transporter periplasmic adaptor subunit [Acidobacteria bacterium]|nr:efflux RND transporter periplasmic adaptor subunit [Acidobacteriota bacterium]
MTVATETVPLAREYPARTYARDMVEVRGRVDGYIEQRTFEIGSDVRAGQVLYVLDRRPYEAELARTRGALAQATADIAQAEANLVKAEQDVQRLEPLVKEEAAARQDLDNALAAVQASRAAVASRKAGVESAQAQVRTAELNLEYATIRAPISGRIGDSLLQVGGLVTRTASDPLTTIVPLDPIWVRFQVSEAELASFQHVDPRTLPIELLLNDGRVQSGRGQIENTLNSVSTRTGTLEVQARFANPDRTLLPGQFARVRIRVTERRDGILIPQMAVQELQGLQTVLLVGADNTVQARNIVTSSRIGERWLVDEGLSAGDTVIVEGLQKAPPGTVVKPMPYEPRPTTPGALTNSSSPTGR